MLWRSNNNACGQLLQNPDPPRMPKYQPCDGYRHQLFWWEILQRSTEVLHSLLSAGNTSRQETNWQKRQQPQKEQRQLIGIRNNNVTSDELKRIPVEGCGNYHTGNQKLTNWCWNMRLQQTRWYKSLVSLKRHAQERHNHRKERTNEEMNPCPNGPRTLRQRYHPLKSQNYPKGDDYR